MTGMRNNRVVHHIPTMRHGGAERQLAYVSDALIRRGWDVHVLVCDGGANLDRLRDSGATVHYLAGSGNYDPRAFVDTIRLLISLEPTLVHTWLTRSDILGGTAARLCGIPWIMSEGSSERGYPPNWRTRLRLRLARGAAAIISNSGGGDEYWAKHLSPRVERFVIGNALPLDEIDAVQTSRHADEKTVISAGRLSSEKNVECLVEGFALAMRHRSFRADIYGDGPRRSAVETAIEHSGKGGNIELKGAIPTLWAPMMAADVFASVSTFEGSPNTVLEAMGCRCSLVLSDIPAHRELAGAIAWYVDPTSPESIAAGIISALDDPSQETRRAKARSIAEQRRPERVAAEFAEVYERVMQRNNTGRSISRASAARPTTEAQLETR